MPVKKSMKELLSNKLITASVSMADVIGPYDTPEAMNEWNWVEEHKFYANVNNSVSQGIWGYMINVELALDLVHHHIPEKILPVLKAAHKEGITFILFYHAKT